MIVRLAEHGENDKSIDLLSCKYKKGSQQEQKMEGLVIGRIVYYVTSTGVRPAIVTYVHNVEGMINACVFSDGSFDWQEPSAAVRKTSIIYDNTVKNINTWHWPID